MNFGELLGYDNTYVFAYSCYNVKQDNDNYVNIDGIQHYTGIKWQCVEYVRRWLILNYNISFQSIKNAYELYTKSIVFYNILNNTKYTK